MLTRPALIGTRMPVQGNVRGRRFGIILLGLIGWIGCTEAPIHGTYEVSILIEGARAPIEATMILTTAYLEGEGRIFEVIPDQDESVGDPNSCLIIPSSDPADDSPRSVTYFETRLRAGEFVTPTTIFEGLEERIEVTNLRFFGDAAGGEIVFYDAETQRSGRIIGDRTGSPDGTRCAEALAKFNARIDELLKAQSPEAPN